MKGWQKRHSEIKEKLIAQTGKRALLVEGTDDVSLFGILLTRKLGAGWETGWVLAYTGKKEFVVDILAQENDWLGIVDRDEWTDEVITEKQRELTNLFVLPRFCIENYAIDPDELWEALPLNQVSVLPEKDQLHRWIHGKQFFSGHVHSVLNNYLGQHDAQSRKIDIFRSCVFPQDLDPLWAMIQH